MKINGLTLPNPDFGYETTVKLPFHFSKLNNGKVSVYDESPVYDMFSTKCSCVMNYETLCAFDALYSDTGRGNVMLLTECISTGFYPFTPAMLSVDASPADSYRVTLNKVDKKGQADTLAKGFRVDFELLLSYDSINYAPARTSAPEGSLSLDSTAGVVINGVRYPVNGFSPFVEYNAYARQMLGGLTETVNYDYLRAGREPKCSSMTITANAGTAINVIRALLLNIRSAPFTINAPANYHVFGMGDGEFMVRLTSAELKVRHTRFDEFEISLSVAEA